MLAQVVGGVVLVLRVLRGDVPEGDVQASRVFSAVVEVLLDDLLASDRLGVIGADRLQHLVLGLGTHRCFRGEGRHVAVLVAVLTFVRFVVMMVVVCLAEVLMMVSRRCCNGSGRNGDAGVFVAIVLELWSCSAPG